MVWPPDPISVVIEKIVAKNQAIAHFWSEAYDWAPIEAANLLSKSRLDWQVSLSRTLNLWFPDPFEVDEQTEDGRLILAWANLGALVEGTMKWFLSVYYETYKTDVDAITSRKGKLIDPDEVKLEPLRIFFGKSIWTAAEDYDPWVKRVQARRNAIHAYRTRDIGTFEEFEGDVRTYLEFLKSLDLRVPYPD